MTDSRIESEGSMLQTISIELSGRYLADLQAAVDRARSRCEAVVADVIGDMPGMTISVTVTDIHR